MPAGGLALAPILTGAAIGAGGALLTHQNPLKGALLGGLGGGITSGLGGLGGATGGLPAGATDLGSAMPWLAGGLPAGATDMGAAMPWLAGSAASSAPSAGGIGNLFSSMMGGGGKDSNGIAKFLPYAALGLGTAALSGGTGKQPTLKQNEDDSASHNIKPSERTGIYIDPNTYFGPGGNRDYFTDTNPAPVPYKRGGAVRGFAMGGTVMPMQKTPFQNPFQPQFQKKPAVLGGPMNGMMPKMNTMPAPMMMPPRMMANGGTPINGAGDGQSDSIPAQLSDGEFVFSAPAVSAIGGGSNNAGAKKLNQMHQRVLKKTYKNPKKPIKGNMMPKMPMGLGSMSMH